MLDIGRHGFFLSIPHHLVLSSYNKVSLRSKSHTYSLAKNNCICQKTRHQDLIFLKIYSTQGLFSNFQVMAFCINTLTVWPEELQVKLAAAYNCCADTQSNNNVSAIIIPESLLS